MQNDNVEDNNIELIYKYTESVLKSIETSINTLNTKLSGVIGFSGVLLKFANDVRTDSPWLITTKIAVCAFLIGAIWFGYLGLQPKNVGDVVSPKELRQDFYYESKEECKRYIVDNWIRAIEQLDQNRDEKFQHLNTAIVSFVLASTIFGFEIIFSSVFQPVA